MSGWAGVYPGAGLGEGVGVVCRPQSSAAGVKHASESGQG
jgi:hypothetical protein